MKSDNCKNPNQIKNENQHKNLPKLEDLKTYDDIENFIWTDYRNPNHPTFKVQRKWGKLMLKEDKSVKDLKKLYWYNENQKNRDWRYQFLFSETKKNYQTTILRNSSMKPT